MSSPAEYYNSLPPVSKAYGTACFLATAAYQLGLCNPMYLALDFKSVFSHFQVWRLITNFFFLGPFSINFGIRLLMIARYGVQLEKGPFDRRPADFLWMMLFGAFSLLIFSVIPFFRSGFMGVSIISMLLYVWSREFPHSQINIYGLVTLKGFYLPWAMLGLDVIFGSPLMPSLLGIIAGHIFYFFTVLHPLAGGKNILKTPNWVCLVCCMKLFIGFHKNNQTADYRHKLVTRWGVAYRPTGQPVQPNRNTGGAFSGRSYRLSG